MPAPKKSRDSTTAGGRAVVTLPPAVAGAVRRMGGGMGGDAGPAEGVRRGVVPLGFFRSGERRGGEKGRIWGSPYYLKKKKNK